jgi:putative ABC transport system substrate-binding protein
MTNLLGRRDFITALGGAAAAWPFAVRAERGEKVRRVGVILPAAADDQEYLTRVGAFLQGLAELGWSVGRNVRIEYRWSAGNAEVSRRHAAELLALAPDVILANGSQALGPLQQLTRTVPIVFVGIVDPVGAGYVASLARPGANVTGFPNFEYSLSAKWLELLKEIAPGVKRAAVLRDPSVSAGSGQFGVIQAMGSVLGVEVSPIDPRQAPEIERAVTAFASTPNGSLIMTPTAFATMHRDLIVALAARHRLPAIYPFRYFVSDGGLISLGPTSVINIGARPLMSTASSRGRSPRTCRCRRRSSTKWRSTSRPPRRSASTCRRPCSRAPTR